MATRYGPSIVTANLAACYDAGNTKSFPTPTSGWNDLCGNTNGYFTVSGYQFNGRGVVLNSGAMTNVALNSGAPVGQAFQVPISPTTGLLSLEMWVKRPSGNLSEQLVNTSLYFTGGQSYEIRYDGSSTTFTSTLYTNSQITLNRSSLNQSVYHQFYYLFNMGVAKLYVDGAFVSSGNAFPTGTRPIAKPMTFGGLCNPTSNPPVFGDAAATVAYGTNVEIGVIRIYSGELSPTDVLQNFNATRGRFGI